MPRRTRIGSAQPRRRIVSLVVATVVVVAGVAALRAQDPPRPDEVAVFMRAKLEHSQLVFEGLALADYELIARGANNLALASQASSWQVLQTPEYARQSSEFRRSCESLRTAARQKNLDAAALAWMEVTLKCIQCHRYVRDERDGDGR